MYLFMYESRKKKEGRAIAGRRKIGKVCSRFIHPFIVRCQEEQNTTSLSQISVTVQL